MNRTAGRLLLLVILFLSVSRQHLQAQPSAGTGPRFQEVTAEDMADAESQWMKKKLKLKKPELNRVKEINLRFAKERMTLLKTNKPDPARLQALEKQQEEALKGALSEKQFTNYLKRRGEIREELQRSGNNSLPPPPPDRF
ncbi:MAG: hypothetical protein QM781_03655 [Chitinophagaceae bacterium]